MPSADPNLPAPVAANLSAAQRIYDRCRTLAGLTEVPGRIHRTYLTDMHQQANEQVTEWMQEAGLSVHIDAAGSVVGQSNPDINPTLVIGSHLDTIPNAGAFDGILGVILAIEALSQIDTTKLPFNVEVIGFGEEEGVRFGTTLMTSKARAGQWQADWWTIEDDQGLTLRSAFESFGLDPAQIQTACPDKPLLAYLEVHIEQGPVLDEMNIPLGVVTGIAAARRFKIEISGQAGHAGTVPMLMRKDALVGAARCVLHTEAMARNLGIVATVGQMTTSPGAINVIPGRAELSLDVRSLDIKLVEQFVSEFRDTLTRELGAMGLSFKLEQIHEADAAHCSADLQTVFADCIQDLGQEPHYLSSGAGHDAMVMAELCNIGMLFVRCEDGISHHPSESVEVADLAWAVTVLNHSITKLAE
ncbi:MAG: allantoate amidohydrolase [Pseudomonadota bacterium]